MPVHREVTHDTAAVLHYTFNRFADLKSRRDRCDCAPTDADAKRCFILPFDRLVSHYLLGLSVSGWPCFPASEQVSAGPAMNQGCACHMRCN